MSNLDGSQLRQLTHMPTNQMALSPTWSPDGKRILYRVDTDCPRNCQLDDIWVMNADGSAQTRLTTGTANSSSSMAHWSPDGSKLLYTYSSDTGETSIYVMNANGSGKTRLMDVWSGGGDAAWQP